MRNEKILHSQTGKEFPTNKKNKEGLLDWLHLA